MLCSFINIIFYKFYYDLLALIAYIKYYKYTLDILYFFKAPSFLAHDTYWLDAVCKNYIIILQVKSNVMPYC